MPLDGGPTPAQLWRIRGYALQGLGRSAEAADCYTRVVEREPGDFESWNNLGNARREAGDFDGAVTALSEASRLRPDMAVLHVNLAAALLEAGRPDESLAAAQRAGHRSR